MENNMENNQVSGLTFNNNHSLLSEKKVMFKFDNDEPVQVASLTKDETFTINLKEGEITFTKDGKSFKLYIGDGK